MPTSKVYNKNKLDNDLNNFFRLKKLKAHFKDSINRDIDDQNRLFKANKQDLTRIKLQTDLKCQFREHCASTSLPKFTNQETKVALLYVHSTATQLSYLNTLTTIYNPL